MDVLGLNLWLLIVMMIMIHTLGFMLLILVVGNVFPGVLFLVIIGFRLPLRRR